MHIVTMPCRQNTYATRQLVATLDLPRFTLYLAGIPIILSTTVPVFLGVDALVAGSVQLTGDMALSANIQAGFTIPSPNAAPQVINLIQIDEHGSGFTLPSLSTTTASATLRFYVLPTPSLSFDYIGELRATQLCSKSTSFCSCPLCCCSPCPCPGNKLCAGGPTLGLKTYVEGIVDFDQTASAGSQSSTVSNQHCAQGPGLVANVGLGEFGH